MSKKNRKKDTFSIGDWEEGSCPCCCTGDSAVSSDKDAVHTWPFQIGSKAKKITQISNILSQNDCTQTNAKGFLAPRSVTTEWPINQVACSANKLTGTVFLGVDCLSLMCSMLLCRQLLMLHCLSAPAAVGLFVVWARSGL